MTGTDRPDHPASTTASRGTGARAPRGRPPEGATAPGTTHRVRADETGGMTGASLLQLLTILAVVGLIIVEVVSVIVATATLDQTSRELARVAGDEYRVLRSVEATTSALEPAAAAQDVRITAIVIEDDELILELEREAPTQVAHRLPLLEEVVTPTSSTRITWTS